jgi:hypothetical protein
MWFPTIVGSDAIYAAKMPTDWNWKIGSVPQPVGVQNAPVTVLPVTVAAAPNTTLIANCSVGMARCSRARDVVREGHVRRHAVE